MKMINAGTAQIAEYSNYQYNCILNKCKQQYYVPVPDLSEVQLFVNFGANKPESLEWTMLEACAYNSTAPVDPDCFKIAYSGQFWYGIFTKFEADVSFNLFSIALKVTYENASEATFFSEQYQLAIAGCSPFAKIAVCYPTNYNAVDINGIYIGNHDPAQPYSGAETMIYQHKFWVRDIEVIETQNQITYKANSKRNFATTLNKIFELRFELVPGWYKDYILSVYFRGNFSINETTTKATDLNFENILEEADLWKAYAKLDVELKGSFGCADIFCADPCICIPVAITPVDLPPIQVGAPYLQNIMLTGSSPFVLADIIKPSWLTVALVGNMVVLSGTPDETGDSGVSFTVTNNCGEASFKSNVVVVPCVPLQFAEYAIPNGVVGESYSYNIDIIGSMPYSLSVTTKPAWMTITVVGSQVVLSGTLTDEGTFDLNFAVSNPCGMEAVEIEFTIAPAAVCKEYFNNTGETQTGISYVSCAGENITDASVAPNQAICAQEGTVIGGGFLIVIGNC